MNLGFERKLVVASAHGDDQLLEPYHLEGYFPGLKVSIDAAGRMVVPKSLRAELGITGPTEVEVISGDGHLELSIPDTPAHVEMQDGLAIIVPEHATPQMTADDVRKAIEDVRR